MSKVNFQAINPVTQYLRNKKAVVNNICNYSGTKEFYSKTGDFIMWQGRNSRVTRDFIWPFVKNISFYKSFSINATKISSNS